MSSKSAAASMNMYGGYAGLPMSAHSNAGFYHGNKPPSRDGVNSTVPGSVKNLTFPQTTHRRAFYQEQQALDPTHVPTRISPRRARHYLDDRILKMVPEESRVDFLLAKGRRHPSETRYKKGFVESPRRNSPRKPMPFLFGAVEKPSKSCQTETVPIIRKEFADIKEFRAYGIERVDPLLKVLRKSIITHKPADVEGYVIAFAMARIRGEEPPVTIEDPKKELRAQEAAAKKAKADAESSMLTSGRKNPPNNVIRIGSVQKVRGMSSSNDTLAELDD